MTRFFYEQHFHFYKPQQAKNEAKAKQHPDVELSLFENYSLFLAMLSFKTNLRYSKKCAKNNNMINKFFFKKK